MISEEEFFDYEVECINKSKKEIILIGYDSNFFNNQKIMDSLNNTKAKMNLLLFPEDTNLENKIRGFIFVRNKKIPSNEGVRIYNFGGPLVYFNLDVQSEFEDKNVSFRWAIEPHSSWIFSSKYNINKKSKEAEYARKIEHIVRETLPLIIPEYVEKFNKKVEFVEKGFPDAEWIESEHFAKIVHARFERLKRKAIPY